MVELYTIPHKIVHDFTHLSLTEAIDKASPLIQQPYLQSLTAIMHLVSKATTVVHCINSDHSVISAFLLTSLPHSRDKARLWFSDLVLINL
jgi:hypothetical protein